MMIRSIVFILVVIVTLVTSENDRIQLRIPAQKQRTEDRLQLRVPARNPAREKSDRLQLRIPSQPLMQKKEQRIQLRVPAKASVRERVVNERQVLRVPQNPQKVNKKISSPPKQKVPSLAYMLNKSKQNAPKKQQPPKMMIPRKRPQESNSDVVELKAAKNSDMVPKMRTPSKESTEAVGRPQLRVPSRQAQMAKKEEGRLRPQMRLSVPMRKEESSSSMALSRPQMRLSVPKRNMKQAEKSDKNSFPSIEHFLKSRSKREAHRGEMSEDEEAGEFEYDSRFDMDDHIVKKEEKEERREKNNEDDEEQIEEKEVALSPLARNSQRIQARVKQVIANVEASRKRFTNEKEMLAADLARLEQLEINEPELKVRIAHKLERILEKIEELANDQKKLKEYLADEIVWDDDLTQRMEEELDAYELDRVKGEVEWRREQQKHDSIIRQNFKEASSDTGNVEKTMLQQLEDRYESFIMKNQGGWKLASQNNKFVSLASDDEYDYYEEEEEDKRAPIQVHQLQLQGWRDRLQTNRDKNEKKKEEENKKDESDEYDEYYDDYYYDDDEYEYYEDDQPNFRLRVPVSPQKAALPAPKPAFRPSLSNFYQRLKNANKETASEKIKKVPNTNQLRDRLRQSVSLRKPDRRVPVLRNKSNKKPALKTSQSSAAVSVAPKRPNMMALAMKMKIAQKNLATKKSPIPRPHTPLSSIRSESKNQEDRLDKLRFQMRHAIPHNRLKENEEKRKLDSLRGRLRPKVKAQVKTATGMVAPHMSGFLNNLKQVRTKNMFGLVHDEDEDDESFTFDDEEDLKAEEKSSSMMKRPPQVRAAALPDLIQPSLKVSKLQQYSDLDDLLNLDIEEMSKRELQKLREYLQLRIAIKEQMEQELISHFDEEAQINERNLAEALEAEEELKRSLLRKAEEQKRREEELQQERLREQERIIREEAERKKLEAQKKAEKAEERRREKLERERKRKEAEEEKKRRKKEQEEERKRKLEEEAARKANEEKLKEKRAKEEEEEEEEKEEHKKESDGAADALGKVEEESEKKNKKPVVGGPGTLKLTDAIS